MCMPANLRLIVDNTKPSLEKKVELEEKIERADWKQWLPLVGLIKATYDKSQGRPTVLDGITDVHHPKYQAWLAMQVASTVIAGGAMLGYTVYLISSR